LKTFDFISFPTNPGVYQFFDKEGKILYVGKAKNLKNRVSSYFRQQHDNRKTQVLVNKIADIKYIITETEYDALLLENNLIKQYSPRYNILLKDDKTYPWICIKKEPFPRIFPTRHKIKDGSEYFGPYASVKIMHTMLDLIREMYHVRSCSLALSEESIAQGKFKACLEYHIGNCKAPCIGKQTQTEYIQMVQEIRQIIKGNYTDVARELKKLMLQYAALYEFEKAQAVKEKMDALEKYRSKSVIVGADIHNVDVFSIEVEKETAYLNYLRISNGAVVQGHTMEMKRHLEETTEELLSIGILEIRSRYQSESTEIVVPMMPDVTFPDLKYTIPQRGDKKTILELSQRNLKYYILEKHKQLAVKDPEKNTLRILEGMQKDLRLKELPRRIECFDNSNFQGDYPVSAMVCFVDAKPSKKDYRHFNIKTVEGPDDFATMRESVFRCYSRRLEEGGEMPNLIVIDGGKGQLGAALDALEDLNLRGKIPILGIAKRLEELYFPGDPLPLYLDKKSESLKVIQHLRNEAHRFGITHYRKRHQKGLIKSELEEIPGIGKTTSEALLSQFKSVKKIKETSLTQLAEVIGPSKAKIVFEYFHKKEQNLGK